jgi:hypothetical protein
MVVISVVIVPVGEEIEVLFVLGQLPELFFDHQVPEFWLKEILRAILSLKAVVALSGALADEVVSDTWAVAKIDVALVLSREFESAAGRAKFFPFTGITLTVVVGIPVPVEIGVHWVLLPPFISTDRLPELGILEIGCALIRVLGAVSIHAINPALKALVALGVARVIRNVDAAVFLGEDLELATGNLEILPADLKLLSLEAKDLVVVALN